MTYMLFIPAYQCAPQISRTLAQVAPFQHRFAEIFVLDNGSVDGTPERAMDAGRSLTATSVLVARNDRNVGLGGSHKVAFQRCLERGYDGVVVLHGDDQGRLEDVVQDLDRTGVECVLGARFMPRSRLDGYVFHRIAANVAFNALFSAVTATALWDLGSGLNVYRRAFLLRRLWEGCADDLTFNYHLILRTAAASVPVAFVPISWREDDQVSNARLYKHGVSTLRLVRDFVLHRRAFLDQNHSAPGGERTYTLLYGHGART
jgi:glycosyltransferase involved in cell wall biosynthesis